MNDMKQIEIIHLSDLHFGKNHRFQPQVTPSGDSIEDNSFPSLAEKLLEDIKRIENPGLIIFCVTGDIVDTGSYNEFSQALKFIENIYGNEIAGQKINKKRFFIVPGNHDLDYQKETMRERWHEWALFYNRLFETNIREDDPNDFAQVYDRVDDLGAIIMCLNSSIYVKKGKPDQDRGRLDIKQLTKIETLLERIDTEKLNSAIKVVLIHHHPILIPSLAEPNRGYDAVINAPMLINILRKYGFHIILHGHKHNPHTFSEDVKSACHTNRCYPIFVASGGSLSSTDIPIHPNISNSYNRITIKWHPNVGHIRIRTNTKFLKIMNDDGTERLPSRWFWRDGETSDNSFYIKSVIPTPVTAHFKKNTINKKHETARVNEYLRTRGNYPIVEVMPSLLPDQAYEARLWIEHHLNPKENRCDSIPKEVVWSAGPKFKPICVKYKDDPKFCIVYNYWGPMLAQAELKFRDGESELVHIYVRLPSNL